MNICSHSLRWLQIILTLFYGQVISTGIYEYIIQGICGLILHIRPVYDSILLIILGLLMFGFVLHATLALWYCRTRMSIISLLILISILVLTSVKSITEILNMGQHPTRIEWIVIRITEFVLRIFGIIGSILFLLRLRQGYKPEDF
jgi:preprotein translocase subunit Sss1